MERSGIKSGTHSEIAAVTASTQLQCSSERVIFKSGDRYISLRQPLMLLETDLVCIAMEHLLNSLLNLIEEELNVPICS